MDTNEDIGLRSRGDKSLVPAAGWFWRASTGGAALLLGLGILAGPAGATSQGVLFVGNITDANRCVVNIINDGHLALSSDMRTLSSKLAGGWGGVADVTSSRAYDMTVEAVPFFTQSPSGGNDNTTFEARFSGVSINKGVNFAERAGNIPVKTLGANSTTRITAQLIATRTGSSFPGGNYQGQVIVRCE
jgi:hypothetical protein